MSRLIVALVLSLSTGCASLLKTQKMENASLAYYTAEGGVIVALGSGEGDDGGSLQNVCLFPPAQAVRLLSPEGEVSANVKDIVDVSGSGKSSHTTTSLYAQTTSTLFLQMAMYRLCEATGNGYVGADEYASSFNKILDAAGDLAEAELGAETERAKAAQEKANEAASKLEAELLRTMQLKALDLQLAEEKNASPAPAPR